VLYRSIEVQHGTQLVGFPSFIDEETYANLTEADLRSYVTDIWSGAIDDPPGSDLPDERLDTGGIAWWRSVDGWTAETGPPDDGLPATRTFLLDQPPRDTRAAIFAAFEREFWLDVPTSVRHVQVSVDVGGIDAELFYDAPVDDRARQHVARLHASLIQALPDGLAVHLRPTYLPADHAPPARARDQPQL
jgi:hypothetical protein